MSRQDAIKELMKAGQAREVIAAIQRHTTSGDAAYGQVRAERGFTPEHQRKMLAQSFMQTDRQLTAELESMARGLARTDHDDAGHVFGVEGIAGDRASLIMARRDAGDRVAEITDRTELRSLLKRATRTGDETLARAVAERATEIADDSTMNAFLADRPNLEQAGERLWNAQQADAGGGMTFEASVALAGLRPEELAFMTVDQIQDLSEAEPETASPATSAFDGNSATAGAAPMASAYAFTKSNWGALT